MRAFPFRHQGRLLRVVVVAVPEAWQLWVCEEDRRLAYAGRVSVDDAIAGWRIGEDRVLELSEEVKSNVLMGKLPIGLAGVDVAADAAMDDAAVDDEGPPLPVDDRLPTTKAN